MWEGGATALAKNRPLRGSFEPSTVFQSVVPDHDAPDAAGEVVLALLPFGSTVARVEVLARNGFILYIFWLCRNEYARIL